MIRVAPQRASDFRAIEETIGTLRSPADIDAYYCELIDRALILNDRFAFIESFDKEFVLAQLRERWAIRNRELFGIPVGVKDVFNTRVLPTTMGSEIWKDFKAGNNARVVDEIIDHGAIVFCKTTTAEFAVHYIQAGRTLNPHNPEHITGTSSAGSAVGVACGALPIALGTQTAASIVRPASYCGVYGFKPSFGAFDRTGTLKTTDTLDTIGLLGSDIYGLRKTFLAAFQKNPQYPLAEHFFERPKSYLAKDRLRVGIVTDQFGGYAGFDDYVKRDFESALSVLTGADVEFSVVPDISFINQVHGLHEHIYCKALSYYFQDEFAHGTGMSPVMEEMIRRGSEISVDDYVAALKRQPELRARFDSVIDHYDFLITPSTASVAPRLGESERPDTGLIWTFFGYPAISIPAFWSEEHGLPFGLQIVGPKFSDLALLDFAERVTERLRSASEVRVAAA